MLCPLIIAYLTTVCHVLAGTQKVDEVLESGIVPGRFFTLLDQKPEETWNKLGRKLGVDPPTLKKIKIDCAVQHQNPSQHIIEIICSSNPNMTMGQFKKKLENINRKDVKAKLDDLPAGIQYMYIFYKVRNTQHDYMNQESW